jgi:peptidyl-prolyl cis-trans isomerase SurA
MRSILMALSLVVASVASAETLDRLAAVVGDEPIALSEVYELGGEFIADTCPAMRRPCVRTAELDILDSLILRVLIRQELASLGQDVTAEELRRTLDDVARDNGMTEQSELRAAVEESGERWEVYRDEIREQLRQGRFQNWIIAPRIPVSEDERLDAYRRMTRDMDGPGKVKFEALTKPIDPEGGPEALPDAVMAARAVWDQLQSGELTWEQALIDYHSGAVTGPTGDRIPAVAPGGMVGALDAAVFSTDVGEIAEPVVASGHVFIVRVQEQIAAEVRPYEEVRDALDQQIKALKGEVEIEAWYQQARREAAVRILLEEL